MRGIAKEKNAFGLWLEKKRIADGMTLQQQAELVGISDSLLCGYSCGARVLTEKTVNRIAEAYDLDAKQLRELYASAMTSEEIARAGKAIELLKTKSMTATELAVWIRYGL